MTTEANAPVMSRIADIHQRPDAEPDFDRLHPDVRRELKKLTVLDDYHAPMGVLFDYAVIAFAIWLSAGVSFWLYPVSLILIGSTQRAFANVLHDSSHKILARNGTWNLLLGTMFTGYLIFHLYTPYRNTHIGGHHRFLGDPQKDPDYAFHMQCGLYDTRTSNRRFFARNVVFALLGLRTPEYVRYIVHDRLRFRVTDTTVSSPVTMRAERIRLALVWAAVLAVLAVAGQLHMLLLFWIVPMFTTFVAIGWLTELAEHFPLPESESKRMLLTRNRHGWAVERFLFGRHHDNLHLVHHVNAGIPFWNMKRAHRLLLQDEAYALWDSLWGGILTRSPGKRDTETLISYAAKYRSWRQQGGEPGLGERSFAEELTLARAV